MSHLTPTHEVSQNVTRRFACLCEFFMRTQVIHSPYSTHRETEMARPGQAWLLNGGPWTGC